MWEGMCKRLYRQARACGATVELDAVKRRAMWQWKRYNDMWLVRYACTCAAMGATAWPIN